MCEFPSWIKTDSGKFFWLTDKDVERFHENGVDEINWYDFVGHYGIENVYGVKGENLEGFLNRIPKKFKSDILSKKCKRIMEAVQIKSIDCQGNQWMIEYSDGSKHWYLNGELNRVDGPAVECSDGSKYWWLNGNLNRVDGPAVECSDGSKHWYLNGKLSRVDGPAIEYSDGTKKCYLNGKLSRVDGPAIEYSDGSKEWWLNGKFVKEERV